MIRIILADDQILLRNTIKYILEKSEDIEVVDAVSNGEEAIKSCKRYRPDVVLLDIKMPGVDGISAVKEIKKVLPETKVLMLTTFENVENIMESFISGADGYIVKDIEAKDLIASIRSICNGLHVIHTSVHKLMVEEFTRLYNKKIKIEKLGREVELSETEIEIIRFVAKGKSNKEIAQILGFAEGTIKNKITRLFEKSGLHDRTQVAVFAIENSII